MTHIITNGETTNGETKTDEPYIPSLDRIEDKLSYFLGKLVEHHVKKAVDAKLQAVVLVTDQLEAELDELKSKTDDFMDRDQVRELITEMSAERDAERDDAVDSSAYVKIEDLADAVRDCIVNGDVTLSVEVS